MRRLLPLCALAACTPDGARLSYGSPADVAALLRANGVAPTPPLACRNPTAAGMVVRAVACTTTLTPAQVAALSAAVPLAPGPASRGGADAGGCETTPGLRAADGATVLVGKNTRVPNGAGPIELHVGAGGAACVEIRYPWSS